MTTTEWQRRKRRKQILTRLGIGSAVLWSAVFTVLILGLLWLAMGWWIVLIPLSILTYIVLTYGIGLGMERLNNYHESREN
jgi:hypothetical protein